MEKQVKEPKSLQAAILYFADPDNCLEYLKARRWPDGIVKCPTCGSDQVSFIPTRRLWECKSKHAKRQFSIKVGTVMEDSAIGLDKWLCAFWMVANCKNGVSSYEIHRTIGVTQKSAWFMLHRIRLALKDTDAAQIGNNGGPVQMDETYIGGNPQKMHRERRLRLQYIRESYHGVRPNKTAVLGMLDRDARQVRATVLSAVRRDELQEAILKHIASGSTVHTDESSAYWWMGREGQFVHEFVNHAREYVNGSVHTNGIENFWSLLKRTLKGTYVAVEPYHLDRYVDEQVFRFNNRATKDNPLDDSDRFCLAVSQIVNKRLTYAELTGKVGETAAN